MQFIKPFTIAMLLTIAGHQSFCQDDYKYPNVDNKFYIAFSPAALIDFADGSSVRISADARLYKGIAIFTEAGFYTSLSDIFSKPDAKGIIIKSGLKVYLNKKKICNGPYIGLEYQYKHQTYTESDRIDTSRTTPSYVKIYGMTRYVNCINARYGELKNITNRIIWEWYVGAGLRFFNSFTDLPQDEYDAILRGEEYHNSADNMSGYQARVLGHHIYPNITAGIKLGVRL